jgi:hypothetical protein
MQYQQGESPTKEECTVKNKLEQALRLLADRVSVDDAASRLGYTNRNGLIQLLRRGGYSWNPQAGTYLPTGEDPPKRTLPALTEDAEMLLARAGEVLALLDSGKGAIADSLSSPLLKGPQLVKSLRLPLPLLQAVEDFARRFAIPQKQVFALALIELLDRRGDRRDPLSRS